MLKANIEARLEAKQNKLKEVEDQILRLGRLIDKFKVQEKELLSDRADLIWKIEELKEELEMLKLLTREGTRDLTIREFGITRDGSTVVKVSDSTGLVRWIDIKELEVVRI